MNSKNAIVTIFCGLFAGIICTNSWAEQLSADEIIKKANHAALYQGADSKGKVKMVITDKQGRTREREFNMLRKDAGTEDSDQKYYVYFQKPADVRKMVFMVHKHAAMESDDDRWLYMPSLDLVKRIAAGDKRTSFVGSDFLYEDISGRSPAEDTHELIETTERFYVIKNVPRNSAGLEFEYYIASIDKITFMPIIIEFLKSGDKLSRVIETMEQQDVKTQENGALVIYPTVTLSVARNMENGSSTEMRFSDIHYNIGLDNKLFTERYLRRPPRNAMR